MEARVFVPCSAAGRDPLALAGRVLPAVLRCPAALAAAVAGLARSAAAAERRTDVYLVGPRHAAVVGVKCRGERRGRLEVKYDVRRPAEVAAGGPPEYAKHTARRLGRDGALAGAAVASLLRGIDAPPHVAAVLRDVADDAAAGRMRRVAVAKTRARTRATMDGAPVKLEATLVLAQDGLGCGDGAAEYLSVCVEGPSAELARAAELLGEAAASGGAAGVVVAGYPGLLERYVADHPGPSLQLRC